MRSTPDEKGQDISDAQCLMDLSAQGRASPVFPLLAVLNEGMRCEGHCVDGSSEQLAMALIKEQKVSAQWCTITCTPAQRFLLATIFSSIQAARPLKECTQFDGHETVSRTHQSSFSHSDDSMGEVKAAHLKLHQEQDCACAETGLCIYAQRNNLVFVVQSGLCLLTCWIESHFSSDEAWTDSN